MTFNFFAAVVYRTWNDGWIRKQYENVANFQLGWSEKMCYFFVAIVMQRNGLSFNCNKFQFLFKSFVNRNQTNQSGHIRIEIVKQQKCVIRNGWNPKRNVYANFIKNSYSVMSQPIFTSFWNRTKKKIRECAKTSNQMSDSFKRNGCFCPFAHHDTNMKWVSIIRNLNTSNCFDFELGECQQWPQI